MKPDLDLMFTCGVNHVYFHGSCYTPKDDAWPGWKFYASVDMSPTNSIWRDAPYLMKYIERCQSFLQMGKPDNDFLVYLPVRDMWRKRMPVKGGKGVLGEELLMQFDIHSMDEKAPEFIRSILTIDSLGYDCDYISDRQLAKVRIENGMLVTEGGTRYKALIIPSGTTIEAALKTQVERLRPYVIVGESAPVMAHFAAAEPMRTEQGLRCIRRQNDEGYHYFIANLTPHDVDDQVALAVPFKSATLYDPMTGDIRTAAVNNGKVQLQLRSGESIIVVCNDKAAQKQTPIKAATANSEMVDLTNGKWTLSFTEDAPKVGKTFTLDKLQTWEKLSEETGVTMGTGIYTTTFQLSAQQAKGLWVIDLGDVRESARVYINNKYIGCAWAVPFLLNCKDALKAGKNTLRIEVTNLPANRIADLDRKGVEWRKMKEINVVDINYKKTTYAGWAPVASGLNSTVKLIKK
jgi:hypothetical protein